MTRVIAAIGGTGAMQPVLTAADITAVVYKGAVDAVHIGPAGAADDLLLEVGSRPVRYLAGDVVETLVSEIGAQDVLAAVVGAREHPSDDPARPAGHVALEVATRVEKPLLLVPPEWRGPRSGRALRLLVPLDGSDESSITVRALVNRVASTDTEIVALHVFDEESTPLFLDHPEHDLPAWAHEFLRRHCDEPGSKLAWRTGPAGAGIADAADSEEVDAVVLGWHQVLSAGRAKAVREVLARAKVPVILVPRVAAERALAIAAGNVRG